MIRIPTARPAAPSYDEPTSTIQRLVEEKGIHSTTSNSTDNHLLVSRHQRAFQTDPSNRYIQNSGAVADERRSTRSLMRVETRPAASPAGTTSRNPICEWKPRHKTGTAPPEDDNSPLPLRTWKTTTTPLQRPRACKPGQRSLERHAATTGGRRQSESHTGQRPFSHPVRTSPDRRTTVADPKHSAPGKQPPSAGRVGHHDVKHQMITQGYATSQTATRGCAFRPQRIHRKTPHSRQPDARRHRPQGRRIHCDPITARIKVHSTGLRRLGNDQPACLEVPPMGWQ